MSDELSFEALMVWRRDPRTGVREYLVIDYEPKLGDGTYGAVQVKFPGGRTQLGERLGETAIREGQEETGLIVRPQNRRYLQLRYASAESGIPQRFFDIERKRCGGKLRDSVKWENHSRISNRQWVSETVLLPMLHPTHRVAFKSAVVRQKSVCPELAKCS